VLLRLGYPEQALARSNAAIAEARRLAQPPSLAVRLSIGYTLLLPVGDRSALDGPAGDLISVVAEQSFAFWSAQGTITEEQAAKFWELRAATTSPACGPIAVAVVKPATSSPRSTGGSARASINPT
jgi:hypothetical protein